MVYNYY